MREFEELTEQEKELIAAIRNYKKSLHNESKRLKWYARDLLEELLSKE